MIYIITGQAAGGTSMMMRVMIEGGVKGNYTSQKPEHTNNILRNPYGCYEGWDINNVDDHVQKIISYAKIKDEIKGKTKIIHIIRDTEQVVLSRLERISKSRDKRDVKFPMPKKDRMLNLLKRNLQYTKDFLKDKDVLVIQFDDMFNDTENQCKRIAEFIAPHPFDIDKAVKAVDKSLYKKRT
jgi:hypothetical protein